jgi:glucose/arabinose dehydrogenase
MTSSSLARVGLTALSLLLSAGAAHAQYAALQVAGSTTGNPLERPVYLTHAPGDYSRVFIVEKIGRIRVLDITQNPQPILQAATGPFLSVTPTGGTGNGGNNDERGLLGLAFHPQYQTNGKFYIYITQTNGGLVDRVWEYTNRNPSTLVPTPASDTADPASARLIMEWPDPQSNHNGGWMAFGPDGNLYIAVGDGGGAYDDDAGHDATTGNGQSKTTPLGKMLRINVDGAGVAPSGGTIGSPAGSYTVPTNNPFVGQPGLDEIWAYGLRNAWRNSFDRQTGDLWMGDVGQDRQEEINFQPALTSTNAAVVGGRNYGWRCFEGTVPIGNTDLNNPSAATTNNNFCPAAFNSPGFTGPVGEYNHGVTPPVPATRNITTATGCSIAGGYVYRGCAIPQLQGQYLFTDYCTGRIFRTTLNTTSGLLNTATEVPAIWTGSAAVTPNIPSVGRPTISLVSFGEDAYGEVYIISSPNTGMNEVTPNGRIFKIVSTAAGTIPLANTDTSRNGQVNIDDIFIFINKWFMLANQADFDRNGSLNLDDIFIFINAWFRGSCPF